MVERPIYGSCLNYDDRMRLVANCGGRWNPLARVVKDEKGRWIYAYLREVQSNG